MNTYLIVSSFLVSITSLAFLVSVVLKGDWNRKNIAFCIFGLSVFVWVTGHLFWQLSATESAAIFWLRCLVLGSSVIPYAYLHFVTEMTQQRRRGLVVLGYGVALVLCVLAFTPYIFSGVEPRMSFAYWPIAAPGFWLYFGGFVVVVIYCYVLLLGNYRESSPSVKNQTKYLILGTGIGFLGGGTNFFLWLNLPIEPWGHGLSIFYILGIGYSVLRYRLIDVHEMAARVLGLVLAAVLFGGLASVGLYWILSIAFEDFSPRSMAFWWAVLSLFGLVSLLASRGVYDVLDHLVAKSLTSRRFAYRGALKGLSNELGADLAEENMHRVVARLREILSLDMAAIYARAELNGSCALRAASGRSELSPTIGGELLRVLFERMRERRKTIFLEEELFYAGAAKQSLLDLLNADRGIRSTDIVIPLMAREELHGFMLLGQSKYQGAFADIDLLLLESLCRDLALELKLRDVERRSNQMEKLVSLGTMAAGLSHELRNPLVSVRTLSSLIRRSPTQLKLTEEFSATVQRDVKRIHGIVDGVSAFAQNTKRPLVPVDLMVVITEARAAMEGLLADARIELKVVVEPDLPHVLGDVEQLIQVMQNMLSNARNAIREWEARPDMGQIELRAIQRGGDLEPKRWVELRVSDNGPGIPDEFKCRIFDPFVTSRDTGRRDGASGTGLGLAIVSKIIERHRGIIQVETNEDNGACFHISLPCV